MDNPRKKIQKRIGELIQQQRKLKKMTQTELGELLGIGKKAVSTYEHGIIKTIPLDKRKKISEILDIPLSNLLYPVERLSEKIRTLNESYEKDISIFRINNPIIVNDFLKSRYYLELEKIYNKQGVSMNKENINYDPSELLTALKFYGFMMQHIDMIVSGTYYNKLLVEFFKVYYPAMVDKLAGVFVDLKTFKNELAEDTPVAFLDDVEVPVVYPIHNSDEETENN